MPFDYSSSLGDPMMEQPLWAELLDSMPSVAATTGWNIGRVSNTITGGGSIGRRARRAAGIDGEWYYSRGGTGSIRQGFAQTLNPRNTRRLKRAANIDPTAYGRDSKLYSPFNVLSSVGNFAYRNMGRLNKVPGGEHMAARMASLAGNRTEGIAFNPGTLGRVRSFHSIANMSDSRFAKSMININAAIADLNPAMHPNFLRGFGNYYLGNTATTLGNRFAMMGGLGETITGNVSGRFAGMVAGAQARHVGGEAITGLRSTMNTNSAFGRGAVAGLEGNVPTGFRHAPAVLRGFNVASYVLLAHDLLEMGDKLIGAGFKTALDAAQSVKGSIDKPVMGMGFKDNTVAATSRQRGVMAIANSRLNMRSFLGAEAAGMHAHFG